MKSASIIVLGALLVPAVAFAQPSAQPVGGVPAYAPPPPGYGPPPGPPPVRGGFHDRAGRISLGFSLGLGQMQIDDSDVGCTGCDGDPVSFSADAHIGWMMSPRLALLFEAHGVGQVIQENEVFTDTLVQSTALVGAQYWVTPQLWIKGGIGAASLTLNRDDGFETISSESLDGAALMGAVGYEVLSARNFAIDLQLRATAASYEDGTVQLDGSTQDTSVGTTTLSLGLNWF